ncbi:SWIM zinc finger family protein [Streptomyces cremeus]|uniref:SWIM zinc finger family protein n=1 Tax=Streptomyces cremeus TaxID=66881 RepID=A0ABV5PBH0_STRCM
MSRASADAEVHSARADAEVHSIRAAADVPPARADAEVHPGPAITDVHPADADAHPAPAAVDAHPSRSDAEAGPAPALVGPASTNPVEPHPAPVAPADVRSLFRGSDDARPVRTAPSDIRPELGAADDRHTASRDFQPVLPAPDDPRPARRDPRQTAQAGAATGDRRRTFPPDPAAAGPAVTWWGKAWVAALEDLSLDPARLARGRAYADAGHVDTITVTPGRVVAYVRGSRARPYRAELRLRTLAPEDWDTFLDAAATDPAHLESLLAKTIPQALLDPASPLAAVPLLPATAGDLLPSCTCPDAGRPCKHAAALCYQVARIVDEDPFVVFLLRGRDEREILDALGHRNAARAATESRTPPAVPALAAREALSRPLGALPPVFPPPTHPGTPPSYPPPYVSGAPDPLTLDHLATDAAQRAHALLTTGADPFAHLTPWQDAVRIAAAQPGSGLTASTRSLYTSLTRALGRTPTDLVKAVAAWRQGGTEALTVLDTPWDPPAGPFDRARSTLLVLGLNFRPAHNRLTAGRFQLRYGQDALWYGYASEQGADDWWPEGPSGPDPVDVLNRLRGT